MQAALSPDRLHKAAELQWGLHPEADPAEAAPSADGTLLGFPQRETTGSESDGHADLVGLHQETPTVRDEFQKL